MSTSTTQQRHDRLRHHLPPRVARRSVDEAWIRGRFLAYQHATTQALVLCLTRADYSALTGSEPPATSLGMTYRHRESGIRVIFLDLEQLQTRGQAELTLAHEMMHAQWWSYGHRPIAFRRAQELIDAVARA